MADGACDKHGALIELAATWCEAQGRAKLDPMAPIWERRAKMLREGYKPQLVSAPSATVPRDKALLDAIQDAMDRMDVTGYGVMHRDLLRRCMSALTERGPT